MIESIRSTIRSRSSQSFLSYMINIPKPSAFLSMCLIVILWACHTPDENAVRLRIQAVVDSIQIVDSHEHLIPEQMRLSIQTDFFHLFKDYIRNDLISAGMSGDSEQYILNPENPLEERWERFSPYWQKTRNTAYARNILLAVNDLFGISDINSDTYQALNQRMLESNKPGWYDYVLKQRAGIEVALLDPLAYGYPPDSIIQIEREFFVRVKRFADFIRIDKERLKILEESSSSSIRSLNDLLSLLDSEFERIADNQEIVGLKSGHAYSRSIYYQEVSRPEAEEIFNKLGQSHQPSIEETKKLQDFVMHHIMRNAEKHQLPFQIHTGILAGTSHLNPIGSTNATHLTNTFTKFNKLKFVIFHGSYPYMAELGVLAKTHPNVYIDMSWMYVISPEASRNALEEWLLTVPANKIMAFGGDYGMTVEATYAHAVVARTIVTDVLTGMVEKAYIDEPDAYYIAHRILRENALELYQLEKVDGYYQRSK